MGTASSQTRLRIKHLLKYLRSYSPDGKETDEEWSARESMTATVGDVITVFKPTTKLVNASDVSELEVDGICLVFGEDADLPMNYYITDTSYDMSFLEGTLSSKANEAKEKGLSLYCLRSSLLASVGMQTKSKLGQMRKLGGSGERKSPSGGVSEPLCQFFSALAIKFDPSMETEPLAVLNLAIALWGDEAQKSEVKGPDLDASFMSVEDENGGLDIDLSAAPAVEATHASGSNGSSASDGAAKMAAAEKDASEVWDMLGSSAKPKAPEMKEESDLKSLFKKHSTGESKKMSSADALFGSSNDEIFASDDFFSAKSVDEMFGSSALTSADEKAKAPATESEPQKSDDAARLKSEEEEKSVAEKAALEANEKAITEANAAADALFRAEADARDTAAKAAEEAKSKAEEAAKATESALLEAEAQAKEAAEKAEQEAKQKLDDEAKAAAEKLAEEARKAEEAAKSELSTADAKANAQEDAQAAELAMYKAQAEAKHAAAKAELEATAKAEEEARAAEAKLEDEAKAAAAKAEEEAKAASAKAQEEARSAAERLVEEAKVTAREQEEAKAKAEEEAKTKAEEEAKAKAEEEAKAKAEEEAKAKAEEEAKAKADEEAKAKAEEEAKAKAEEEAKAKAEEEAKAKSAEDSKESEASTGIQTQAESLSTELQSEEPAKEEAASSSDDSELKDKLRAQAKGNEDVLNRKDLPTRQKIELLLAKQKAAAAAKAKAKAEEAAAEAAKAEQKLPEEAPSGEERASENKNDSADVEDSDETDSGSSDSISRPQKKLSLQATLTKLEEQSQKAHQKIDEFKKTHEIACREDLHLIETKSASFESDFKERLNSVRKEIVVKMRKLSVQATDKLSEIIDEGKVRIEERGPHSLQQLDSVGKAIDLSSVDKGLDLARSKFASYVQERLSVLNLFAEGKDPLDAIVEEEIARIREWRATELQDYIQLFEKVSGRFESRVQLILSEIDGIAKSILDEIERLRDFDTRRYDSVARELSEAIANTRRFGEMHARAAADTALSRTIFPALASIKENLSKHADELRGEVAKKLDEHAKHSIQDFDQILDATKECFNKTANELEELKKTSVERESAAVKERLSKLEEHLAALQEELRKSAEAAASGNADKENSFESQAAAIGSNCSCDVDESFDRIKENLVEERKAASVALKSRAEQKQAELTQRVKELFEKRKAARQDALKKLDERLDQLAESVEAISSQLIQ